MKRARLLWLLFPLFVILATLTGCAMGTQLQTVTADPKTITGTYDLYTYGCRYPDDLEHAAFLIVPEKAGMVELYVPATSYKIKRGLPADKALAEADAFVRCGIHTVTELRVHRIPDGSNGTIGYEILPRYPYYDDGGTDPLLVSYTLKDGQVTVYIRLFPDVERRLNLQFPAAGGQ
ncbi:MAG: hypothetical protein HGB21_08055 [Nitrospirae bacterium]|nr:hypothetical protein [Nitrospirota bacterium]NTW66241.1 hypothetical protein [Nitrospirota bacterium]